MAAKITIPVSYIFFPITFPIRLVRLALAGVLAVVLSPMTFMEAIYTARRTIKPDAPFGYRRKYEILDTEYKSFSRGSLNSHRNYFKIHEVLITPGFLVRLGGAKPNLLTLWMGDGAFLTDGSDIPSRIYNGVKKVIRTQEEKKNNAEKKKNRLRIMQEACAPTSH